MCYYIANYLFCLLEFFFKFYEPRLSNVLHPFSWREDEKDAVYFMLCCLELEKEMHHLIVIK